MGILTDSLHQLDRSITKKETQKEREKREQKEIEIKLYNFFIYHFKQFPKSYEKNYCYYLGTKPRQELHKKIAPNIDFLEFYKIYDKILDTIYKRYKKIYKIQNEETEKREKEEQKEIEQYKKAIQKNYKLKQQKQQTRRKLINNILGSFLIGLLIPTRKKKNKYKI